MLTNDNLHYDEAGFETLASRYIALLDTTGSRQYTDSVAPVLQSVSAENNTPNQIVLTYAELIGLDPASVPAINDYVVSNRTLTNLALDTDLRTVTLTVDTPFTDSDIITVGYTAGANPLQDLAGNLAANLSNQAVINNISPAVTASYQWLASTATNIGTFSWIDSVDSQPLVSGANNDPQIIDDSGVALVQFNKTNTEAVQSQDLGLTQPFTVLMLGRYHTNTDAQDTAFDGLSFSSAALRTANNNSIFTVQASSVLNTSFSVDLEYHIFAIHFDGANSTVYIDGGDPVAQGNGGTETPGGIKLGASGSDIRHSNFQLAELQILEGTLNESAIDFVANQIIRNGVNIYAGWTAIDSQLLFESSFDDTALTPIQDHIPNAGAVMYPTNGDIVIHSSGNRITATGADPGGPSWIA